MFMVEDLRTFTTVVWLKLHTDKMKIKSTAYTLLHFLLTKINVCQVQQTLFRQMF